jgi:hypothetical protein
VAGNQESQGAPRRAAARGHTGFDGTLLMRDKVIISCAVTGSAHTPTMSDALPAGLMGGHLSEIRHFGSLRV